MKWAPDQEGKTKTYVGSFKSTLPSGVGTETIVDADGQKEIYKGKFDKGIRHGAGKLEKDGEVFEANWVEGEPDEETIEKKEVPKVAGGALMASLRKNLADKFLEELKRK